MKHKIVACLITWLAFLLPSFAGNKLWKPTDLVDPFTIDSTNYILDELGYLSDSAKASLNSFCARFNHDVDMELAIVMLDEIEDDSFEFGLELYNHWGLGRNSRGLLLTILVEEHVWQFNTGDGAEGVFPDGLLFQVGTRKLVPHFRKDDYAGGIQSALEELYQIALAENRDEYFESNGYDKSNFANFSRPNSSGDDDSNYSYNNYSSEESTWSEIGMGIYMIILFVFGVISSGMAHFNDSLQETEEALQSTILDNNHASVYYKGEKSNGVGAWANLGCLRYLIVDIGFVITCLIAALEEDSFLYLVIGFFAYLTYWALTWFIMARIQIKKAGNDANARFLGYTLFNQTTCLRGFKVFAPWIGLPISWCFSSQAKKYKKDIMTCPICQTEISKISITDEEFTPSTNIEKVEEENSIFQHYKAKCNRGHIVTIGLPGKSYNRYEVCNCCQERTATQTKSVTKSQATYAHDGKRELTFTCKNCGKSTIKYERIPKLTHTSSSGGGHSGGGYSGGSRGGGHSSGGGSRGGW